MSAAILFFSLEICLTMCCKSQTESEIFLLNSSSLSIGEDVFFINESRILNDFKEIMFRLANVKRIFSQIRA